MNVPIEAKENQWDISKSKTATPLDEKYQTKVTLSLPSKSEKLESDVVFVLDKSTSAQVEDQALEMLEKLRMQIDKTDAKVKVGIVIFNKIANVSSWFDLSSQFDKFEVAIEKILLPEQIVMRGYLLEKKCWIKIKRWKLNANI